MAKAKTLKRRLNFELILLRKKAGYSTLRRFLFRTCLFRTTYKMYEADRYITMPPPRMLWYFSRALKCGTADVIKCFRKRRTIDVIFWKLYYSKCNGRPSYSHFEETYQFVLDLYEKKEWPKKDFPPWSEIKGALAGEKDGERDAIARMEVCKAPLGISKSRSRNGAGLGRDRAVPNSVQSNGKRNKSKQTSKSNKRKGRLL